MTSRLLHQKKARDTLFLQKLCVFLNPFVVAALYFTPSPSSTAKCGNKVNITSYFLGSQWNDEAVCQIWLCSRGWSPTIWATTKRLLAKMSLGCSQKAGKLSSCGWLLERNYPACGEQTKGTLVRMSRTWDLCGCMKLDVAVWQALALCLNPAKMCVQSLPALSVLPWGWGGTGRNKRLSSEQLMLQ